MIVETFLFRNSERNPGWYPEKRPDYDNSNLADLIYHDFVDHDLSIEPSLEEEIRAFGAASWTNSFIRNGDVAELILDLPDDRIKEALDPRHQKLFDRLNRATKSRARTRRGYHVGKVYLACELLTQGYQRAVERFPIAPQLSPAFATFLRESFNAISQGRIEPFGFRLSYETHLVVDRIEGNATQET